MLLKIFVAIGSLACFMLIPAAIVCFLCSNAFANYLRKQYPELGRKNAWQVGNLSAGNPELLKLAKRVRLSLYVMLAIFAVFLISGAGIAMIGN